MLGPGFLWSAIILSTVHTKFHESSNTNLAIYARFRKRCQVDIEAYSDCRSDSAIVRRLYKLGDTGSREELCLSGRLGH